MMTTFDLLDIYEVLIHIRFSLDSKEAIQLVTALVEALYMRLGILLDNQSTKQSSIRNYILRNCAIKNINFGMLDNYYFNNDFVWEEATVVFSFLIIAYSIKEKLSMNKYEEAFCLVDEVHNYPINLITSKRNAKKILIQTVKKLLNRTEDYSLL